MEEGIRSHDEEDDREERRSLRVYGFTQGERQSHLSLQSTTLGLTGRIDLAIASPSRNAPDAEGAVVEYKLSENKAGTHFKLQLAAYAMLLGEAWQIPVRQAFLYSIPLRKVEKIAVTPLLRRKVIQTTEQIRKMVEREIMPSPPSTQYRCVTCEFRRFCNDVV
jgi:CRISPR-associated exonuclease Cas4